jgi:hypothetical protein
MAPDGFRTTMSGQGQKTRRLDWAQRLHQRFQSPLDDFIFWEIRSGFHRKFSFAQ